MFQHLELHRLRQRTVSLVSGHIEVQILPLLFCFVFLKTAAACNITQGLEASVWKSNKFKQRCCSDKPESCHSFLLNKKNQLNEMMVGRRLLRRWEYSCRSWRGAAGQCTRRSRRCSCTLAPSAWRRRRKHWSGTGWGRPAYSASPTNTKEVERQG